MATRVAVRGFIHQLEEYLRQKPPAEYPLNRGHRIRGFSGGQLNRYNPLSKKSLGPRGSGAFCQVRQDRNVINYVSTIGPVYAAQPNDYHISVAAINVNIQLPLVQVAGVGKFITVKDAIGGCGPLNPIIIIPAPGDTLDGMPANFLMIVPFSTYSLVSDGGTNWEVL